MRRSLKIFVCLAVLPLSVFGQTGWPSTPYYFDWGPYSFAAANAADSNYRLQQLEWLTATGNSLRSSQLLNVQNAVTAMYNEVALRRAEAQSQSQNEVGLLGLLGTGIAALDGHLVGAAVDVNNMRYTLQGLAFNSVDASGKPFGQSVSDGANAMYAANVTLGTHLPNIDANLVGQDYQNGGFFGVGNLAGKILQDQRYQHQWLTYTNVPMGPTNGLNTRWYSAGEMAFLTLSGISNLHGGFFQELGTNYAGGSSNSWASQMLSNTAAGGTAPLRPVGPTIWDTNASSGKRDMKHDATEENPLDSTVANQASAEAGSNDLVVWFQNLTGGSAFFPNGSGSGLQVTFQGRVLDFDPYHYANWNSLGVFSRFVLGAMAFLILGVRIVKDTTRLVEVSGSSVQLAAPQITLWGFSVGVPLVFVYAAVFIGICAGIPATIIAFLTSKGWDLNTMLQGVFDLSPFVGGWQDIFFYLANWAVPLSVLGTLALAYIGWLATRGVMTGGIVLVQKLLLR